MTGGGDVTWTFAWTRSSFCSSGGCVEVALDDCCRIVLVRDSQLGDASPVQAWELWEWDGLLEALAADRYAPAAGAALVGDDGARVGLLRHLECFDPLFFTPGEWDDFTRGVRAGEFAWQRLRARFDTSLPASEGPLVGSGVACHGVGAASVEATGAGSDSAVLPASVADVDLPAREPVDGPADTPGAAAGAVDAAMTPASAAAIDVPAGWATRTDSPGLGVEEVGRPGPLVSEAARRASREAVLRVYLTGIMQDSVAIGDVLDACADAAVDAALESTWAAQCASLVSLDGAL